MSDMMIVNLLKKLFRKKKHPNEIVFERILHNNELCLIIPVSVAEDLMFIKNNSTKKWK